MPAAKSSKSPKADAATPEVTTPEVTTPDVGTPDVGTPEVVAESAEVQEAPPANPLEALRRAQAARVPPPGSNPHGGPVGGRGGNPKSPRMYNRHK